MTGPCIFRPLRFSSLNQRALMQISGARTRTHAAGVEQRACRAGPEGVSGMPRIIEPRKRGFSKSVSDLERKC